MSALKNLKSYAFLCKTLSKFFAPSGLVYYEHSFNFGGYCLQNYVF